MGTTKILLTSETNLQWKFHTDILFSFAHTAFSYFDLFSVFTFDVHATVLSRQSWGKIRTSDRMTCLISCTDYNGGHGAVPQRDTNMADLFFAKLFSPSYFSGKYWLNQKSFEVVFLFAVQFSWIWLLKVHAIIFLLLQMKTKNSRVNTERTKP